MKVNIKTLLRESMVYEVIDSLLDEDYPSNWDIEKFKGLSSFNQRIRYCEDNLQRISSGSSRIVYKIDDEKVLKLAKNRKGLAQNEVEISHSGYHDIKDILARVFEYDGNNLWVEMELARKVTVGNFKQITGYDFKLYCEALGKYAKEANPREYKHRQYNVPQDIWEEMWEDEFIYDIFNYIAGYDIPIGDLSRMNSYGVVKRNGEDTVVIIDFGLDGDVYGTYYS